MKQRKNTVLILPLFSKRLYPKWSKMILTQDIKGLDATAACWIQKSKIGKVHKEKISQRHVKVDITFSQNIYKWILQKNTKKIFSIKKKIKNRINIYLVTNSKKDLNLIKELYARWKHFDFKNSCPKDLNKYINSFRQSK